MSKKKTKPLTELACAATPIEGRANLKGMGAVHLRAAEIVANEETYPRRGPFRPMTSVEVGGWCDHAFNEDVPKDPKRLAGWLARQICASGTHWE